MNATTTATRIATNDQGQKFNLPASWPTHEEIKDMQFGLSVFRDLLKFCQNTIIAGTSISEKDRSQLWESIEEGFLAANGSTWQEMLEELRDMLANTPASQDTKQYPDCLAPLNESEVQELENIYNEAGKFRPVTKPVYCQLFKGAASSRRHGVSWKVWGKRTTDAGFARGLVALIAVRAYSMDSAEVVKVGA